jgi:haloalkane dehalogenase
MTTEISAADPFERHQIDVLDSHMSYIDTGPGSQGGDPIVFLHGNPTSSYLWRNIIPHVQDLGRCLAPDLIGMGASGPSSDGSYRFVDHARYLDAWLDAVGVTENATFVIHDWGSALGFHWSNRHRDAVRGLCYMEAIVRPMDWEEWPPADIFLRMRSEEGDEMILGGNFFVEVILPRSVLRGLTDEELEVYRRPYLEAGESRRPTLTWPREIPLSGEPADVVEIAGAYSQWLAETEVPKLLVSAEPGAILNGPMLEFARGFKNQTEVRVPGSHFIQEDSPHEIGAALAEWYPTTA